MAAHRRRCPGPQVSQDDPDHVIRIPEGQGVHCWACDQFRRTVWIPPDFCCATCKAVLVTVGDVQYLN